MCCLIFVFLIPYKHGVLGQLWFLGLHISKKFSSLETVFEHFFNINVSDAKNNPFFNVRDNRSSSSIEHTSS